MPKLSSPEIEIVGPGGNGLLIGKSGLLLPNANRNWLVKLLVNTELYENVSVREVEVVEAPNPARFVKTNVSPGLIAWSGF